MNNYKKFALTSILLSSLAYAANDELQLDADLSIVNGGSPSVLDEPTKLTDVHWDDATIVYDFQLMNVDKTKACEERYKNKYLAEQNACSNEMVQYLFEKDLEVKLVFKVEKDEIFSMNLNKKFCSRINQENNLML